MGFIIHTDGGARSVGMPQTSISTKCWRWAVGNRRMGLKATKTAAIAATKVRVRNWQSTQVCVVVVSCPRCPWQWC